MRTYECLSQKIQEVMNTPDYADFKKITEIFAEFFPEER